jgi:histidinol-phosphatase (PHP family)
MLPCDSHVHSEWSWDTGGPTSPAAGSMEQTCAGAKTMGLPALVFSDQLDLTGWRLEADDVLEHLRELIAPHGVLTPPAMYLVGYLECVARCRQRFRDLRVLTGLNSASRTATVTPQPSSST